jgi:metallo-beta-lactamase family protein
MSANRLGSVPIFVDSPLASAATNVFRMHPECFDEETAVLLDDAPDLFGEKRVRYVESVEESQRLNERKDPCILIAASGMCEAGRILHHLKYNIEDPRNTVLIIGFQAPHTLGRRIVEKLPELRIHDRYYKLKAEVQVLNGFSSHADHQDLLRMLSPLKESANQVCLVHGEPDAAKALSHDLLSQGFSKVDYPEKGARVGV